MSKRNKIIAAGAGALGSGGRRCRIRGRRIRWRQRAGDLGIRAGRRRRPLALAHTGEGTVSDTEMGDEESYYEVEVTLDDGSQVDVQLDKGFDVVGDEADAEGEDEAGEADGSVAAPGAEVPRYPPTGNRGDRIRRRQARPPPAGGRPRGSLPRS